MNSNVQRLFFVCGMLLLNFGFVWSQAKISFEKTRHDFGEIKEEEGVVSTIFKFENTGNKALLLESVKATCGCTTPIWSRDSVAPGYFGFIKVEFNPLGRPGILHKEVIVETNGSPAVLKLAIVGKVTPRPKGPKDYYPFESGNILFRTNHLTYGTILDDAVAIESTILYNNGKQTIKFSKSGSKVPPHLNPKMSKSSLAPGDTLTLWVEYHAALRKDYGFTFDDFFLMTNDPGQQMKRINISANIEEHFTSEQKAVAAKAVVPKTSHDFGILMQGQMPTATFTLKNEGKSTLIIRKLSAACSCVTLEGCKDLEPGESCEIEATFNSRGRIGEFEKEIILILNSPSQTEWRFELKGRIMIENDLDEAPVDDDEGQQDEEEDQN